MAIVCSFGGLIMLTIMVGILAAICVVIIVGMVLEGLSVR